MTIRTFWVIFIKLLGIWLVLDSVTIIPQFFSTLFFIDPNETTQSLGLMIALLLLSLGVYMFILRLFVFKTSWLIDKLQLTKGFDEEKIDLNVQLSTVLTVTVIVFGGLMFVGNLPQFCKEAFIFFQQKSVFRESPSSGWLIYYFAATLVGYILMTNSKQVVRFIVKKTAQQNEDNQ